MEIKNDTLKIKEASNDIIRISNEINEIIENLYTLIQKVSSASGIWSGMSSQTFIEKALIEKTEQVALKNNIFDIGKMLAEYADSLEQRISEVSK